MPTYKLPKVKSSKEDGEMASVTGSPETYERMVTVPVNDEILKEFKVGDKIEMTLMGNVTELRKHDSEYSQRRSIELTITEVKAYGESGNNDNDEKGDEKKKEKKEKKDVEAGMKQMISGFKKVNSHNSDDY